MLSILTARALPGKMTGSNVEVANQPRFMWTLYATLHRPIFPQTRYDNRQKSRFKPYVENSLVMELQCSIEHIAFASGTSPDIDAS
jgi:hypothetical protein